MNIGVSVVQNDLAALNKDLALYMELSKKTAQEVVDKKGVDLGIKLFKGFWSLRTAGGKGAWSGPMFSQAAARGWRTRVRTRAIEDDPYLSIWQFGSFKSRRLRKGEMKTKTEGASRSRRGLAVAQELARRQRGAGLLGISFLQRRWRGRGNDTYLAVNKSRKLGTLASFESGKTDDGGAFFRIVNYTPGIDVVGARGVFEAAVRAVRDDMAPYLVRKQIEALRKAIKQPAG